MKLKIRCFVILLFVFSVSLIIGREFIQLVSEYKSLPHNTAFVDKSEIQTNEPGGLGMTYSGKIGIDLGGGIILPFGGSPGMGFGF